MGETPTVSIIVATRNPGDSLQRCIDSNDQNVIFNIVDESVNNARKHAEAGHIWVRLGRQEDYLLLEVQDDGVGFDTGEVDANYDRRGSLGMINLRERSELLDGTLRIDSAEGKGTKITVIAPIREGVLKELAEEAQRETRSRPPEGKGTLSREASKARRPDNDSKLKRPTAPKPPA